MRYVRRNHVTSIRASAKALQRDYSNVHSNARALVAIGLLDSQSGSLITEYDAIETKIAI